MAHVVIVIAGLHSIVTPTITVRDCYFAITMAIVVIGLHSSCSIIDNNVSTFYIKTIGNPVPISGP